MPVLVADPPVRTALEQPSGALDQVWEAFFRALQRTVTRLTTLMFDTGTAGQVLTAHGPGVDPTFQAPLDLLQIEVFT